MNNCTKNTAIGKASPRSATKQLPLFTEEIDPPAYPLQIEAISYENRVNPNRYCKLVHLRSGLNIPGQFSYDEAKEILLTTRYWDWELDKDRIPRCVERLRSLLENICAQGSKSGGEADA